MRLWHCRLLPYLPRLQLVSQWRECCCIAKSIAEKGTPNHILVNKIMDYPIDHFVEYCYNVCIEMEYRGYRCDFSRLDRYLETEDSFKKVAETATDVQDAMSKLAEGKGLSHNEAWKLLKEDADGYLQSIKLVNGEYFFSQEELIKFKDAKIKASIIDGVPLRNGNQIFPEWHNDIYLRQCLYNLEEKAMCKGAPAEEWQKIYDRFKDFTPLQEIQ